MVKLTQTIVRELLDYNPATGVLTWKKRGLRWFLDCKHPYCYCSRWNSQFAGKEAFKPKVGLKKPRQSFVAKQRIFAHRLIWLWMTGALPHLLVDHKDQNPFNNRWSNLREVTNSQNLRNAKKRKNNTSGVNGVFKNSDQRYRKPYFATINTDEGGKFLGRFFTLEEATKARKAADLKYGYTELHGVR